ncbi:MAG: sigma-70 family RNA polymerase sigma factor [Ruminococcus sp.]|nr:sigma-70 family RNA polymerase sigma factor [Ruminococcus sp.]
MNDVRKTRVSLDVHQVDVELLRMFNSPSNDDRLRRIAKLALVDIIKSELSEKQRKYIILYYYKGLKIDEIAKQSGVNKSTVSRTLSRARANIARRMKYYIEFGNRFSDEEDW